MTAREHIAVVLRRVAHHIAPVAVDGDLLAMLHRLAAPEVPAVAPAPHEHRLSVTGCATCDGFIAIADSFERRHFAKVLALCGHGPFMVDESGYSRCVLHGSPCQ